jgi:hypothetical protein
VYEIPASGEVFTPNVMSAEVARKLRAVADYRRTRMTVYIGRLPEGFEWVGMDARDPKGAAKDTGVVLMHDGHLLAVVKPMGRAWVAMVNPAYCSKDYPSCIVPKREKGQVWIAKWARTSLLGIRKLCAQRPPTPDPVCWPQESVSHQLAQR